MSAIGQMLFDKYQNYDPPGHARPKGSIISPSKTPHKDPAPFYPRNDNFSDNLLVTNTPLMNKELPVDENTNFVPDNILPSVVQSPSDSPVKGSILFPDPDLPSAKLSSVVSRLELVENRLDQNDNRTDNIDTRNDKIENLQADLTARISALEQKVDKHFDILTNQLALLLSLMSPAPAVPHPPSFQIVPAPDSASSVQPSEPPLVLANSSVQPPDPAVSKNTVPSAWNGTNSQIKAAAPRSPPVVPAKAKPTPAQSIQASDPPPRPKVIQGPIGTSAASSARPRRTTTSMLHNPSRLADGEPDRHSCRLPTGSGN